MDLETNTEMATDRHARRRDMVASAAEIVGATPADIPGLWWVPGYPELTTGQLLQIASER